MHRVVVVSTPEKIIARIPEDQIVSGLANHKVTSGTSVQFIRTALPKNLIIPGPTKGDIGRVVITGSVKAMAENFVVAGTT